ncbi:MAG: EAL domain-containing protein [Actinobacteria bacterium]|nr:EAL domain-containing protein [Actinomycetota bacterium]
MANEADLATAVADAVHPLGVMQRITDRTLGLIESAQGVMIGVADPSGVTYVTGSGNQTLLIGTRVELGSSLTGVAVRTGEVQRSADTELDDRVDLEACRRHHVRSLVCIPLQRDDEVMGVMAVNAPVPDAFTDADVDVLTQLATFMGVAIGSARDLHAVSSELLGFGSTTPSGAPATAAHRYVMGVVNAAEATRLENCERIEAILGDPALLSTVFQPVVDLASGETVAYEALSRFHVAPYLPPDRWFAEAHACGLGVDLEVLALERAFAVLPSLADGLALNVNVGPHVVGTSAFLDALAGVPVDRVILELTEHHAVEDYPALIAALRPLRRAGLRVAVDDTGSGYSSLAHILKIAPDFIKLDCELASTIDLDPVRRALAASLVAFAADTGAEIVAEGVENADELAVLRRIGVRFAQGYHLGHPAPLAPAPVVNPARLADGEG